jgi:vacuolar-type H+-ATPase subunit H
MNTENYLHHFTNWAKERLDEINATLKSMEGRVGALRDEAKTQTEKAISDIRAQRDVFQKAISDQQNENEAAWMKARSDLASNWATFETSVQKYMTDARNTAEQQQSMFMARAEAQRQAWQQSIETMLRQAGTFAAAKRQDLDAAVNHVKAEAEAAKSKLDATGRAGEQSWVAMRTALEESRAAFDKASKKAQDAFKQPA